MTANTPGILDFLHEFKREVYEGKDIFTVGEANGVAPEDLPKWVGSQGVFDMVFEFSHMNLALKNGEIWCRYTKWKLPELKNALTASQKMTANNGWCPVFFENHDQPRCVNHFFPQGADTRKAAKVIATVLLTLRGTPFIYEGQELGYTNVAWPSIDNYNDISSHGQYKIALEEGFTPEQAMKFVHYFSRDNARTPMQWNTGLNAGFSSGKPWLPVHDDYLAVNTLTESEDPGSVLSWYKTMAEFRRSHKELTEGSYEELLPEDEQVFAFARTSGKRRLVTVANFSLREAKLPDGFMKGKSILMSSEPGGDATVLRPLEARVYRDK